MQFIPKLLFLFFVMTTSIGWVAGQPKTVNKKQIVHALNAYILYVNEVNNYLPIINSLMIDYNMKLNKFVDLPSHEPSLFSNALLPNNLFDDVYSQYSPNDLYNKATELSPFLPVGDRDKIMKIAKLFFANTSFINAARFEVESLLTTLDLNKRENVSLVYDKMEAVANAFKLSKKLQYELEYEIKISYKNLGLNTYQNDILKSLEDIYSLSRLIIESFYENNMEELPDLIESHDKLIDQLSVINMMDSIDSFWARSDTTLILIKHIIDKSKLLKSEVNKYLKFENIPDKYALYGRNYFFYNHSFLNSFNRFGMGIAYEINVIHRINKLDKLLYLELPYDYKVVYPRVIREEMFLPSSTAFIKTLPQKVQEREVVKADRVIEVDRTEIEFEVYDHKIIDGDIVSILFNGEWILEKFKLTEKKHKFKIKLNESGVNYLLLHADDEGTRPPATIALAYYANNTRTQIILNSDKLKSELIEIVLKK